MSDTPAPRIPVEERLFSLVLALLATEAGLTKSEILTVVQGYRGRYRQGQDNSAIERQFERDKDDIRELGVPLETIDDPGDPGNNQNLRYRIPKGAYDLPHDVEFSAEERALLDLAAMVWREGEVAGESRRALIKLRGLSAADDVAREPVLGVEPRLRLRDPAFAPLRDALERHVLVKFPYLKPGQAEARRREVIPLALLLYQGRWHLSAEEPDTGLRKNFLLRRIVGPVQTGKAAPDRDGDFYAEAIEGLERVWEEGVAEVRVAPDTDAAVRLVRRRGAEDLGEGRLRLHWVDLAILADELAAFGPEVVVLSPPELRSAVIERLDRTAADHG